MNRNPMALPGLACEREALACMPRFPDCHDPFWPRIDLPVLRKRLALEARVSDAGLGLAVRCAAIEAAKEFATWRTALRGRGYQRLEDIGGHRQGRALSLCYVRYLEAAVMKALASTGQLSVAGKKVGHG
ncbi:head completion/stabilization protein [Pseudomonas sp. S31]|uniref:head completion/stabilization protein n=1 Tax=Pseudomonas sp. S31 TaxID=1564473 RepID=UPI003FA74D1D|nr:head completion/stabilization protein [Pseudomonas sp. S31]